MRIFSMISLDYRYSFTRIKEKISASLVGMLWVRKGHWRWSSIDLKVEDWLCSIRIALHRWMDCWLIDWHEKFTNLHSVCCLRIWWDQGMWMSGPEDFRRWLQWRNWIVLERVDESTLDRRTSSMKYPYDERQRLIGTMDHSFLDATMKEEDKNETRRSNTCKKCSHWLCNDVIQCADDVFSACSSKGYY